MKDNRKIWIYTLTDPRNNLVKYIGKTFRLNRRLNDHINEINSNTKKTAWIKNLKKENLKPIFEILEETNIEDCNFLEIYWIGQFKVWGFDLKNTTNGGDGSYGIEPWNKGLKGVFKHSEESKKKMSEWRKENTTGEKNGFFGKKHSEKNIKIFKEKSSKRRWSEEFKENRRGEKSPNSKKVFQYDLDGKLIKEYSYGKQTEKFGFDSNMVSKVCRGIHKSHKGYVFSFEIK